MQEQRFARAWACSTVFGLAALCASPPALAESVNLTYLEGRLPVATDAIATLGADLFGDKVNLYNGALEFEHTDLQLPGNNGLRVALTRRYTPGRIPLVRGQFGDWDLDVPRIGGTFSIAGWATASGGANRCSGFSAPPTVVGYVAYPDPGPGAPLPRGVVPSVSGPMPPPPKWKPVSVAPSEYWYGTYLHAPGANGQEVLARSSSYLTAPQDGGSYPLVTRDNWQIGCLPALQNGAGEGFVAVSPEGVRYRFDWMASRTQTDVKKLGAAVMRKDIFLFATEVTDRFGNWVRYSYDAGAPLSLMRIEASDGRVITLQNTNGKVTSASDGTRTYVYGYNGQNDLSSVQQPDGSQWIFNLSSMLYPFYPDLGEGANCDFPGAYPGEGEPLVGTITHPSGAVGTFTTQFRQHGRTFVDRVCNYPPQNTVNSYGAVWSRYTQSQTLITKAISGPALAPLTWSYSYTGQGGWTTCTTCSDRKVVTVTNPLGYVTRYTFGNRWRVNEGQLLQVDEGWDGSAALRTTTTRYRLPDGQAYPGAFGYSMLLTSDWLAAFNRPVDQRVVTQQGSTFVWEVAAGASGFDAFARPLVVNKSSSLGYAHTETTAYHDNRNKWVLGLVASVVDAGLMREQTSHDPVTANPTASYSFGRLLRTLTYNPDGTIREQRDPLGRATTFNDYWRGVPRGIVRRDGTVETAAVNNLGNITSVTNAAGTTTNYGFDSMGRLASITYPPETSGSYHATVLTFEPVAYNEYGIAPGHWRQTISTGNARTVRYFDALWRVGLTRTFDAANEAGTSRMVEMRYDPDGRKVFEGEPQRSIGTIGGGVPGRSWFFDALGRNTAMRQDSELGPLDTVTQYLANFQRRTTNPRGYATTMAFQAFDSPSEEAPATIWAPEGATVSIARDVFGKPNAITRSGNGKSLTRSYVYDGNQRLCKTIEPESGASVQAYDGAGHLAWRASGLSLPGGSCDQASVPESRKISHGYDAVDQLVSTSYGDGSPGVTRSYTPDGLLQQVASNQTVWTYGYNNRRLLTQELYSLPGTAPGQGWNFYWGIDAYGHVNGLTDPWGPMAYAPNALGEATQLQGYASNVTYHPNGTVAGYTLTNGITHSRSLNPRGLPSLWQDTGVVRDQYSYDAAGNVAAIADQQEGVAGRNMGYDGLDRLTQANGIWGAAVFGYDALDNLVSSTVGSRSLLHNVDATTNRLTSLTGSASIGMVYDANGNLLQRGAQGFAFDIGNRLASATGKVNYYTYDGHGRRSQTSFADGDWRMQAYSQAGKLLFAYRSSQGYTRYVHLGDKLIAENNEGKITFNHTDALGSPVVRTSPSGALVSRTRYEPYGGTSAGTNPSGIGFTGHVNDPETGLVYMQQRYYDPIAGRFLSVDPVTTNAKDGSFFGRYHYANNNPFKYRDPDGQASCVDEQCTVSTIDRFIPRQDGRITLVTFVNDNPAGSSPNQPISTATANLVESIISKSNVDSININSTTGGHTPPSNHSSARAVDINKVDGKPVSSANRGAAKIQESAKSESGTRENFGPKTMEKTSTPGGAAAKVTDPKLTAAHQNHVHISNQP